MSDRTANRPAWHVNRNAHINGIAGAAATAGVTFGFAAIALGLVAAVAATVLGPAPAGSYTRGHQVQFAILSVAVLAVVAAVAYAAGVAVSRSESDGRGLSRWYDAAAGMILAAVMVSNDMGDAPVLPGLAVYLLLPTLLGVFRRPVCLLGSTRDP